jgi:protein-L-isoaspartate(D-aspartate) O-methyltransferase
MSTNIEKARFNMIQQQIRPAEVLDQRVLDTINRIPREDFVPAAFRELAFADTNIPLSRTREPGKLMMKPIMEARLLQALNVQPGDKILEVGTGSGYFTALLATLGGHVHSVEIDAELLGQAQAKLAAHNITNVSLLEGDAAQGWSQNNPYDVIAITGSLPILPDSFKQALNIGGRLVAIVGTSPVMEALLIMRIAEDQWATEVLFETDFPSLENALQPEAFVF